MKVPKSENSMMNEKHQIEELIAKMDDPELAEFVKSLPPEKVNSLPDLIAEVRKHKGRFKNYEVILLSLETFLHR
jgi:hypothetical protein